ncbi:MAG: MFS transporter [Caldilineae bacterium]|nr:MAG: MFS transporter [Caldilineae bacterium]
MSRKNSRLVVIAVLCASLAVMLSTGIRQSFGLFLQPVTESLGAGREIYSLAIAIGNLVYGLPLVGIIADRLGPRWVVVAGGLLYAVSLVAITSIASPAGLYLTLGVALGIALSATTYVVVLGAVAQLVPPSSRSRTFGLITAAGSSGMFLVPPLAQALMNAFGWRMALILLAVVAAVVAVLAFGLPARPGRHDGTEVEEPFLQVLHRARGHSGYLLLISGFFVCGFHVAFVATHLPSYLGDAGLPAWVGATALALIGAFNLVGSMTFGWLGDRFRKKYLLSFLYFARAAVITLFLVIPLSTTTALIFAGTIGFLWLATVPLTSGTVAQIFGSRYLSTLYGIVFFSHQIGAFLGVWLGGRFFDATGSYTPVWLTAIALGVFAGLVHLPISDRPATAPQAVRA